VLGSAPPFLVLAFDVPLWTVLAVFGTCGAITGMINPIISAVMFERIPAHLVGRVTALAGSLAWVGIPLGGLAGGAVVALVGLNPALWLAGVTYLLTTTLPGLHPAWRDMDRHRHTEPVPN
jgi:MFS family permease